jgi:hypothetical protein
VSAPSSIAHRRASAAAAVWVLSAPSACNEQPLEPRHKVTTPRILAIIAEPPEVRPGQSTELRVITGGTTVEPEFSWFVCARSEATTTFAAQSTFGQAEPNDACFGDAGASNVRLPFNGPNALFATPSDLLQRLEALRAVYGSNISAGRLTEIARTAGLPLTIAVELRHNDPGTDGGPPSHTVVRALKRVVVVDRAELNRNPPGPSFRFGAPRDGGPGGVAMRYVRDGDDERCEPADGSGPLAVRPGTLIEIAPDPTELPWLQRYLILDTYGMPAEQTETAFYSFYSTGGAYRDDRTRIPTRNTLWEAPQRQGPITHWLIVRDGRGGASACRYDVTVSADAGPLSSRDASPDPEVGSNTLEPPRDGSVPSMDASIDAGRDR